MKSRDTVFKSFAIFCVTYNVHMLSVLILYLYRWGRWKDIVSHARFKRPMEEKDVENVAKAIVSYIDYIYP